VIQFKAKTQIDYVAAQMASRSYNTKLIYQKIYTYYKMFSHLPYNKITETNEEREGKIQITYLQGGAVNRGLLFAALSLSQLGGCERKDV
jgi:hypothetical protein